MTDQPDQPEQTDNTDQVVQLRLSVDELAFLLQQMELHVLPGFRPPEALTSDNLTTARRCLLARGFLQRENGALQLNELIGMMVSAGRDASRILSITHVDAADSQEQHWFYFLPGKYSICQYFVGEEIVVFESIDTSLRLSLFWARALHLRTEDDEVEREPDADAVTVPQDVYDKGRVMTRNGNPDGAHEYLLSNGLPDSLAEALVYSDNRNTVSATEIVDGEDVTTHRVVVDVGPGVGYWTLTPVEGGMDAAPSSALGIVTLLSGLIQ